MAIDCIEVSTNFEDKDCIEISTNVDECPKIYAVVSFVSNTLEEIQITPSELDCYTAMYHVDNFDSGATYYAYIDDFGTVYYGGNGTFHYTRPRRNIPSEELLFFKTRAKKGSNYTEYYEAVPTKLPITPTPTFGTPSNPQPNADETITIPITNWVNGTSLYDTPITTDSGYAVVVSGEIHWVLGSDVGYGETHTLSLVGFDDCSSESETATIEITTNKYSYVQDLDSDECPPLCTDGQYFDCESESCVEYSGYVFKVVGGTTKITRWHDNYQTGNMMSGEMFRDYHNDQPSRYDIQPTQETITFYENCEFISSSSDFCSPCTSSSEREYIYVNEIPNEIRTKILGSGTTEYLIGSFTVSLNSSTVCPCGTCYGGMWEEEYVWDVLGLNPEAYHQIDWEDTNTFEIYGVK